MKGNMKRNWRLYLIITIVVGLGVFACVWNWYTLSTWVSEDEQKVLTQYDCKILAPSIDEGCVYYLVNDYEVTQSGNLVFSDYCKVKLGCLSGNIKEIKIVENNENIVSQGLYSIIQNKSKP